MVETFDFDGDDFVELLPEGKQTVVSPIAIRTICLRGGVERISLSFSREAIAKLEGWPRFAMKWNAATHTLGIRASVDGPYEARKSVRGERYLLRVALPAGIRHVPKVTEPAPHRYGEDGRTVFLIVPPVFRAAPRPALPAPGKAAPTRHEAAVAAARAAVPAPLSR